MGKEASTLVISAKGTDFATCTGSVPALRNVKSLQYLGNPDLSMPTISVFSDAYFLGINTEVTATDMMAVLRLGSFAITGENAQVLLCAEMTCKADSSVCVDNSKLNGLYLVRDAPADRTTRWPRIVRTIQIETTPNFCTSYRQPPYPSARSLLFKNESILDVYEYVPQENSQCYE